MIQHQDDAQAAKKIGPPPANIKWVDNDRMPSREEQDRLDALASEEDAALTTEEVDDGPADLNHKTNNDATNKDKAGKQQ